VTSVHSAAHGLDHRFPALDQAFELQGLALVEFGDFFELRDFLEHQRQIAKRPQPGARHIRVSVQGLTAENDAAVGFGWRHGARQ